MKKKKGISICAVLLILCVLSLLFCDKMKKELQDQVRISDSELEKYTALAYDLSEIHLGKISKVLIQGQKQKISFVFPGSGNQQVTVDYSAEDYRINSNAVSLEQIDSSVIVLNKLLNLNIDKIYRIEFDNARKIVSIQGNPTSKGIFIVDFSDDRNIVRNLEPSDELSRTIYIWKDFLPMIFICVTVLLIIYMLPQMFKKKFLG